MWTVLAWLYLGVAALAMGLTWREQRRTRNKTLAFRYLGYFLCLFWPLILLVALVMQQLRR